jgi:uncharacterized protein YkwD
LAGGTINGGRVPRALALFAAALLALLTLLATRPPVSSAASGCPFAGAKAHTITLKQVRRSITCLINHKRQARGRRTLDANAKLQGAAQGHTKVMLQQDCLQHKCPGEHGFNQRMRDSGYLKGAKAWGYAENLGYENTPHQMLRRFLHKRFDRQNMLNRKFRDVGVGVGWGAPVAGLDDSKFATYTVDFAWRRR